VAELAFPFVATLALVFVAIPLATLASKLVLIALGSALSRPARARDGAGDASAERVRRDGSTQRYLLLVAPVAVPALWLVSAAAHHAEAEGAALACLFDHVAGGVCAEPWLIALVVAFALASSFLWRRHAATRGIGARRADDPKAQRRIARARALHPRLRHARIELVEGDELRTIGLLRPRIEVGVAVARTLDAQALGGALLHEHEHVRGRDPLRFVIASVCQSLNPAAFLLTEDLAAWRAGREVVCDEAAVHHGADPCGLAEALITVARPQAANHSAYLGRGGIDLLRVRVTLLMSYLTSPARCHCAPIGYRLAALAIVVFASLPHYWGEHVINQLHQGAERAAFDAFAAR
jgi:beta-lactamase regulating signal transducer with metallopeptidase domain